MLVELSKLLNGSASFDVVEPNVALSHDTPVIMPDTAAVHILTNRPLTSSHGKKTIAKELYLWHGAHCYYCIGGGGRMKARNHIENRNNFSTVMYRWPRGRYLAHSGTLGSIRPPTWHSAEYILGVLLNLAALAIITNRVLVLPPVYFHEKVFASWEWFDVFDLRKIIQWRESTFFSNPKIKYFPPPDDPTRQEPTIAMLHVGTDEIRFGNVTAETGNELFPSLYWPNPIPEKPSRDEVRQYKRAIWGAATSDATGARDADVLFVDFSTGQDIHEEVCFFRKKKTCQMGSADKILGELYSLVSFCDFQDGYIAKRQTKGWLAHMDCRTRMEIWKAIRSRGKKKVIKDFKSNDFPIQETWGKLNIPKQ